MHIQEHKERRRLYQAHKYIAGNLRLLRCVNGLNQDQVAVKLNMSRSSYSSLEGGSRIPDIVTLYEISQLYDISLDYLLSFDISQHVLSLINRGACETDAHTFLENYLSLSHAGREHIKAKIEQLAIRDKSFNRFPWNYESGSGQWD